MKAFMQQVPDFDWGLLGEATKVYAADLQLEIEEEAAQALKAAEEEAHKTMDKEGASRLIFLVIVYNFCELASFFVKHFLRCVGAFISSTIVIQFV